MAQKLSPTLVLLNVIQENYDLGDVQIPETMDAVHQRRHRKLIVDTDKGRFLVKTYKRDPVVLDNLRFQHRLSSHLEKNGLPVAHIQETSDGRRIIEVENWALELQRFVEGESMRVTGRNLYTSARALGKFHVVCRDFPCPDRDARKWRFSEVPRDLFAKLYETAKKQTSSHQLDDQCNNIALFLREAANELNEDACNVFETGLIHGDWHSGNLIFQDNKLAAIIDLEFAGDGCYLEDLSYAISNLCIRTTVEHEKLEQRTDILLENYQKFRTLAPSEEKALYYAVGIKHVATVCYQSMQTDGTVAGHSAHEWMKRLDLQTQWLGERAQTLHIGWG